MLLIDNGLPSSMVRFVRALVQIKSILVAITLPILPITFFFVVISLYFAFGSIRLRRMANANLFLDLLYGKRAWNIL